MSGGRRGPLARKAEPDQPDRLTLLAKSALPLPAGLKAVNVAV